MIRTKNREAASLDNIPYEVLERHFVITFLKFEMLHMIKTQQGVEVKVAVLHFSLKRKRFSINN